MTIINGYQAVAIPKGEKLKIRNSGTVPVFMLGGGHFEYTAVEQRGLGRSLTGDKPIPANGYILPSGCEREMGTVGYAGHHPITGEKGMFHFFSVGGAGEITIEVLMELIPWKNLPKRLEWIHQQ